jgi:hypothetical protein
LVVGKLGRVADGDDIGINVLMILNADALI